MGMPKQERLARRLRLELPHAPAIVCGGAILDFMSGNVERAPQPMRRLGLEWLYRLCREPRRLFRRYVLGNPLFILRLVRWRDPAVR
jgi:N-acetylglucosaminyldiphosphoundecaprenol N-acetyl-beta-D-mannosaminyltransferase